MANCHIVGIDDWWYCWLTNTWPLPSWLGWSDFLYVWLCLEPGSVTCLLGRMLEWTRPDNSSMSISVTSRVVCHITDSENQDSKFLWNVVQNDAAQFSVLSSFKSSVFLDLMTMIHWQWWFNILYFENFDYDSSNADRSYSVVLVVLILIPFDIRLGVLWAKRLSADFSKPGAGQPIVFWAALGFSYFQALHTESMNHEWRILSHESSVMWWPECFAGILYLTLAWFSQKIQWRWKIHQSESILNTENTTANILLSPSLILWNNSDYFGIRLEKKIEVCHSPNGSRTVLERFLFYARVAIFLVLTSHES